MGLLGRQLRFNGFGIADVEREGTQLFQLQVPRARKQRSRFRPLNIRNAMLREVSRSDQDEE